MTDFEWVAAVVVGTLSVARTARFLIWDEFPPMEWLRGYLIAWLGDSWGKLFTCQFCLAPYLAAGMVGWAWLADLNTAWWVINGIWGGSYIAAMIVSYDQPE